MTPDPFTEAARAEAERRYNRIVRRNKTADEWLDEGRASGFASGAEWARTHLAAQEPTDGERAVRNLHRPARVYTLSEECTDPDAHEWSEASHGGDYICLDEPTAQEFCAECCPEDTFDCTDYPYPCATIRALDSARAARRDEGKR